MGQAGAQREPSMEEILASIRRIIENNEPGADGLRVDGGAAFSQHDADESAADDTAHDGASVDQSSARPRPVANDESAVHPVSLADVAARARAVPETGPADTASAESPPESPLSAADAMDAAAEELREALTSDEPVEAAAKVVVAAIEKTQDQPVAAKPEPEVAAQPEPRPEPQPVRSAPAPLPEAQAAPAEQPVNAQPASSTEQPQSGQQGFGQQGAGQLVSLQTGEKVAAAFGELDAAIAAGQRRSFDEIAEEMLRPMLTQWLDDNLPTLVERLVREEIERVSRGNRG